METGTVTVAGATAEFGPDAKQGRQQHVVLLINADRIPRPTRAYDGAADAPPCFRLTSACWRDGCLSADGAVQCVDQDLNFDEFVAGALGLVAVEWRGQHLCMRVPVFGHART